MSSGSFREHPSRMSRARFIDYFGGVYEHSPWLAERAWDQGIDARHDQIDALAQSMAQTLADASREQQLALIRAHPDLAGKAAMRGELTQASTEEQASAGLDQCSVEEFERFQSLNAAYSKKFGFPFIIAVKGLTRDQILGAFVERLQNDPEREFQTALTQIKQIARLRLALL